MTPLPSLLQDDDVTDLASVVVGRSSRRICEWCDGKYDAVHGNSRFCSRKCRQAAWRCRSRRIQELIDGQPLKIAYADPPYPGFAKRLYGAETNYQGEVNHRHLITSLVDQYDGWALSTGAYALRELLPLCPAGVRVCAWVKPIGAKPTTFGIHNSWEPVIVKEARRLRPGRRDWLSAQPARSGGTLIGRKPLAFCVWLFELLGMQRQDVFEDLFPGTGIVTRAWREVSRTPGVDDCPLIEE